MSENTIHLTNISDGLIALSWRRLGPWSTPARRSLNG